MKYSCSRCAFGELRPAKSTYVRRVGTHLLTIPDFPVWRCDCCGNTRYDSAALSMITSILGPEEDDFGDVRRSYSKSREGPDEDGPHRWSM